MNNQGLEQNVVLQFEIKKISHSGETGDFIILVPNRNTSQFGMFMTIHQPYEDETQECEMLGIAGHPISGPLRMYMNGGESYCNDLHFVVMTVSVEETLKKVIEQVSDPKVEITIFPETAEDNIIFKDT